MEVRELMAKMIDLEAENRERNSKSNQEENPKKVKKKKPVRRGRPYCNCCR